MINSNDTEVTQTKRVVEDNKNEKRGMVLPFAPHSITFTDIKYAVDMPAVLHSCCFRLLSVTSIMKFRTIYL